MPVYNTEKYVKQAIQSILNQTFTNFELIIINDGSTDDSLKIIQSFDDKRIKIIQNQINQGISFSLNKGVNLAEGKYIARMDADDISMPNRLEKQVEFLSNNPSIDFVGCSIKGIDRLGKPKRFSIRDYNHKRIECLLLFTCPFYHPTIMAKKAVFANLKYDTKYDGMEDWELWTRIVRQYKTANISDVLLQYRRHENNTSKTIGLTKNSQLHQLLNKQLSHYMNIDDTQLTDIHVATCTDFIILNRISKIDVEVSKNWLLKLNEINKKYAYFDNKNFEFAINLTWFNFISRTIKNRNYSIFKLLISDTLTLSNRQRFYLFLKSIYCLKLDFIDFIFNIINTKRND